MYNQIQYSSKKFQNILSRNIKESDYEYFINLINKPYISISGSSILELISNENWKSNDLDIYISLSKINNVSDIKDLLYYLFTNYTNEYSLKYSINKAIDFIISTLETKFYNTIILNTEYNYQVLNNYLKYYLQFINGNKKIELIFISCDIESLLINTFDYDIVKNYWTEKKVYSFNYYNIQNKIACMTLNHFLTIILKNKHIYDHFLKRYIKYTERGYKLFINKTLITLHLINYIYTIHFNSKNIVDSNDCISFKYLYKNKNKKIINELLITNKHSYIITYILILGLYQKYKLIKNLKLYNNILIEVYLNPDSIYIKNKFQIQKNNNKGIYYITDNNKLKLLTYN